MCFLCKPDAPVDWDVSTIYQRKRHIPFSQWCQGVRSALCTAIENNPQIILGSITGPVRTRTPLRAPKTRQNQHRVTYRDRIISGLRSNPALSASELLVLKEFFPVHSWEFVACAFSHYNTVRLKYHRTWCNRCSNSYECDWAKHAPLELLSLPSLTATETTYLFLQQSNLKYHDVRHILRVDGDWLSTIVQNEWPTLCAQQAPRVDRRRTALHSKRSFQIVLRALHRQRRALRASPSTLLRCAYVALAAVFQDRSAAGYNLRFQLPKKFLQYTPHDQPFGRSTVLTYSTTQNLYVVQTISSS